MRATDAGVLQHRGGLAGQQAGLRATFDQAANDGSAAYPLGVANISQYADAMHKTITEDRCWLTYMRYPVPAS